MRALRVAVGILLVLLGVALVPTPVPGVVVILLGAALIARESPRVARGLAAVRLRLRALLQQRAR